MQEILTQFVNYVEQNNLNIYGISINEDGKDYTHIWKDGRNNVYSIGKSITAICIFICVEQGKLKLDQKIVDIFPYLKYSPGTDQLTVQNLLDMTTGKDVSWILDENGKIPTNRDYLELFFEEPITLDESVFRYSNLCSYTLGRIVEEVTGFVLLDFANTNVFKKLDIISPRWRTDHDGHTICATDLFLSTKEMANIGKMIVDGGYFNGKYIFTSPSLDTADFNQFQERLEYINHSRGYKNSMWICNQMDAFRMEGIYSNYVIVSPKRKISIAITGDEKVKRDHKELDFLLSLIEEHTKIKI